MELNKPTSQLIIVKEYDIKSNKLDFNLEI